MNTTSGSVDSRCVSISFLLIFDFCFILDDTGKVKDSLINIL